MGWKIKPKIATELRKRSGKLTEEAVVEIFEGFLTKKSAGMNIPISGELQEKYFADMGQQEILSLIDLDYNRCDFHRQRQAKSLRQAIKIIKDHDRYQIEVRGMS